MTIEWKICNAHICSLHSKAKLTENVDRDREIRRERERDWEREKDRVTHSQRDRDRDRERLWEREKEGERETKREVGGNKMQGIIPYLFSLKRRQFGKSKATACKVLFE